MATLEEWKETHRTENPTISKMVDGIIQPLESDEYNETINMWAQNSYENEQDEGMFENGGETPRYADFRVSAEDGYPSVENQLDMMYHDRIDGSTTWRDAITAVKNKYRKPS